MAAAGLFTGTATPPKSRRGVIRPLHPYLSQHLRPVIPAPSATAPNRTHYVPRDRTDHVLKTLSLARLAPQPTPLASSARS